MKSVLDWSETGDDQLLYVMVMIVRDLQNSTTRLETELQGAKRRNETALSSWLPVFVTKSRKVLIPLSGLVHKQLKISNS